MIAKLYPNRVRRTYLGGGRIDAFCGSQADVSDGVPRPEDWMASTVQAFNGSLEIDGEGMGRLEPVSLVFSEKQSGPDRFQSVQRERKRGNSENAAVFQP